MSQVQSLTDELNSGFGISRPTWLSRFVRDEVRPFLVQNREAVAAALSRWFISIADQSQQKHAWDMRRDDFLNQQSAVIEQPPNTLISPPESGVDLIVGTVQRNGRPVTVCGWGPPDLKGWGPTVDYPLPIVFHRDLSADECVAALIVIHDEVRDSKERIGPDMKGEFSLQERFSFALLRSRVLPTDDEEPVGLTEGDLPELRGMLKKAATTVQAIISSVPVSKNDKPDFIAAPPLAGDGNTEQFEITSPIVELTEIQQAEEMVQTVKLFEGDSSAQIAVIQSVFYSTPPNSNFANEESIKSDVKGKNINAQMLLQLQSDPTKLRWTAQQWAMHLDCSEGTVKGTKTWKNSIMVARAMQRAESIQKG